MNDAIQRIAGAEEQQVGRNTQMLSKANKKQSAIDSQAGTPSAESIVGPGPGNSLSFSRRISRKPIGANFVAGLSTQGNIVSRNREYDSGNYPKMKLNKLWRRLVDRCECTTNCPLQSHPCVVELKADNGMPILSAR